MNHRYPLSVQLFTKKSRNGLFLRASARIFVRRLKSEFVVVFELTGEEMVNHRLSGSGSGGSGSDEHAQDNVVEHVGCAVDVKYGSVE